MQQRPPVRVRAAFFLASTCFTTPLALHRSRFQSARPPDTTWASVVNASVAWWKRNHVKASDSGEHAAFPQAVAGPGAVDGPLPLGVSPLGDSPWSCNYLPRAKWLRECTDEQLEKYREIVDELRDTTLMDVGIFLSHDLRPCKNSAVYPALNHTGVVDVVVDAQYSDQPACCQVKDIPSGDAAQAFKEGESNASLSGDITSHSTSGIRYGSYGSIVYSFLEPTSKACTRADKCPVVVEVPGASTVPWLLLQAWCTGCLQDLGTIVVSVDNVEDPSLAFVKDQFIPAVIDFLETRSYVDIDRVYLTSTSKGNEIGMLAVLLRPQLFTFALFAGKSFISRDIERAAKMADAPAGGMRLRKVSFHIGAYDGVHDEDQDYWARMDVFVTRLALPIEMELRYYPGGTHAMWYAGWNAYRDLLWTGRRSIGDYASRLTLTCAP